LPDCTLYFHLIPSANTISPQIQPQHLKSSQTSNRQEESSCPHLKLSIQKHLLRSICFSDILCLSFAIGSLPLRRVLRNIPRRSPDPPLCVSYYFNSSRAPSLRLESVQL